MLRKYRYFFVELPPKFCSLNLLRPLSSDVSTSQALNLDNTARTEDTEYFEESENTLSSEDIELKCNKSRLKNYHRNIVNNEVPQYNVGLEYQSQLSHQRKVYGNYGSASGVDPSVCWPTSEELSLKKEYEMTCRPLSLQQMVAESVEKRKQEKENIIKREEEIAMKLEKLAKWKEALNERIRKKEAEAFAAKAKKDRMIEEIRRYFGFKVDPKDERFKEMLEKKEKEEKKLAKEAKKKAREEKLLRKLASEAEISQASAQQPGEATSNPQTSKVENDSKSSEHQNKQ